MHTYTIDLSTHQHTIQISPSTSYGYFEHVNGNYEGGLWFDPKNRHVLIDYDGVSELPVDIINALMRAGYTSDDEWEGASIDADQLREFVASGGAMSKAGARYAASLARRMIAIGC